MDTEVQHIEVEGKGQPNSSLRDTFFELTTWFKGYITPEAAEHIRAHKYAGADLGYSYIYFWSPIANKIVQRLPMSLAPNTITLLGFLHTVAAFTTMCAVPEVGMGFEGPVPRWFCFLQFWCFFWYRMLDEVDGKQARRTGNSSALGLLFDHGVDCFTLIF